MQTSGPISSDSDSTGLDNDLESTFSQASPPVLILGPTLRNADGVSSPF